ncbi:hypothetical protein [Demequina iriomotensis]|uniref:hypothetical protein n=1 Tax=Demequina iriomotensis TaxID=1536641 RepID=UPI0007803113|nr:hypothetical protein [Demequina iriomotensis]
MRTEQRSSRALGLIAAVAVILAMLPPLAGVATALGLLALACVAGAGVLAFMAEDQAPRHAAR